MNTEKSHADYIAERKAEEVSRKNRAAENLSNHAYTQLIADSGVEVWRCMAPKTTSYAFDIMVSRFGIAIVGDIDNLTFSVGISYGIEFLAGDDVTYYIHTKLSECHKKREFSETKFKEVIASHICQEIAELIDDEDFEALPDWAKVPCRIVGDQHWSDLRTLVSDQTVIDDAADIWSTWDDLLDTASEIGFTEEAQLFMRDNSEPLGLGDEWYEHRIDEVCEGLIDELYMINHASKEIMSIKKAAEAEQSKPVELAI